MSFGDVATWNDHLEGASATAVLEWAWDTFGNGLNLASSFGAEDVVLIDLCSRAQLPVPVFMLDTGRLHEETYALVEQVRNRYRCGITVVFPQTEAVQAYVQERGFNGFYESLDARRACCNVRKVEPLQRALEGKHAWVTGLRRDQNVTRTRTTPVEFDIANRGIYKINPLAAWSRDDVWAYIREHDVPYNPLHDQGFASIGCAPCTRAIQAGEDERAGRWWWEARDAKECGLHGGAK